MELPRDQTQGLVQSPSSPYGTFLVKDGVMMEQQRHPEAKGSSTAPILISNPSYKTLEKRTLIFAFYAKGPTTPNACFDTTYPNALREIICASEFHVMMSMVNTLAKSIPECFIREDELYCGGIECPFACFSFCDPNSSLYELNVDEFLRKRKAIADYLQFCSQRFKERGLSIRLSWDDAKNPCRGRVTHAFYSKPFWIEFKFLVGLHPDNVDGEATETSVYPISLENSLN
eukprot:TRINITY_DN5967_c0_g1_i1.p1 TRINITY_DN5967_c0_g1~~TRINITY_DN5967_c0_g1_i1.p1  ORF type:complete len:231 (+),score=46.27 TRINITY_DN5967_c0_g1_i1:198-890(+)